MLFPYLQCNECGWIPEGEMRKRALIFARKYIKQNPKKETQLQIILEEEARQTLKLMKKNNRKKKGKTIPTPPRERKGKMDLISLISISIIVFLIVLAMIIENSIVKQILGVIIMLNIFIFALCFVLQYRSKKVRKK